MSPTRRGERCAAAAIASAAVVAVACNAPMSTLRSAGSGASGALSVFWFMVALAALVYVVVIAVMIFAVARRRSESASVDLTERSALPVIVGGAVIPAAILVVVFLAGLAAMRAYPARGAERAVSYKVTGYQWWWDVEYEDPMLDRRFRTANEIHVPVGRPVRITLVSGDVIHSFWVPRLQGKIDLIPGDTNEIRFVARKPGTYRGQCAEYCGLQHAHMALTVVAEDSASFEQWLATQRAPAAVPADSVTALGERTVVTGPCAMCHTIRGTEAAGQIAPDLTHVGSRATIAAGALPNSLGNIEAWITNAQSLKPGARMPSLTQFTGTQLRAMALYLQSLR